MVGFLAIGAVAGMMLGFRFRVLVLVPATLFVTGVVTAVGLVGGQQFQSDCTHGGFNRRVASGWIHRRLRCRSRAASAFACKIRSDDSLLASADIGPIRCAD